MTEWREVPEITEEHIGWTVAIGSEWPTIEEVYSNVFRSSIKGYNVSGVDHVWNLAKKGKSNWLVKPPEKEKPKPEPWGFWWVKQTDGLLGISAWYMYGPCRESSVKGSKEIFIAKPDKDGKFYPPED